MGWLRVYNNIMSNFYEQLCESFIKPSRQTYQRHDLGRAVHADGKRTDFEILNKRNLKLVCSYYAHNNQHSAPCLVYLHGFNGSRLESLAYADTVLATGMNMCAFDFAGTGLSEGEYVSLGAHEQHDVMAVLQHLRATFNVRKFALWGRSMGAVAAIKFSGLLHSLQLTTRKQSAPDFQLISMVLDSPFHSLMELAMEIGKSKVAIPDLLIKAVLMMVKSTIETKASFKMKQLELLPDASTIHCPVLIIASKEDKLVHYSHADKIYQAILHRNKEILFIKGEHYDMREEKVIRYAINFLATATTKGLNSCKNIPQLHSSKALRYAVPYFKKSEAVDKPSARSVIKDNPINNSLDLKVQRSPALADRMKTHGSPNPSDSNHSNDKNPPKNSSKSGADLGSNTLNRGNAGRQKQGVGSMGLDANYEEHIVNSYKTPYFEGSRWKQNDISFETPSKLKPKVKKHTKSHQALETKSFSSQNKLLFQGGKADLKNKEKPAIRVVDAKKIKKETFPIMESLEIKRSKEWTDQAEGYKSKDSNTVLNPNIRILGNSWSLEKTREFEVYPDSSNSPVKQEEGNHYNVITDKLRKGRKRPVGREVLVIQPVAERKWVVNSRQDVSENEEKTPKK